MEEEKNKSYRHYLEVFKDVLISHGEQLIELKLELHELKRQLEENKTARLSEEVEDLIHSNKNAVIVLTEVLKDKKILKEKELHRKYMQLMSGQRSMEMEEEIVAVRKTAKRSRQKSEKVTLPKTALSYTICKRFFRSAGADRVGDDALLAYNKLLISTSNKIITAAVQIQKKNGEKKLTEYHIRDAYEQLLTKTFLPPEVLDILKTYAPGVAPPPVKEEIVLVKRTVAAPKKRTKKTVIKKVKAKRSSSGKKKRSSKKAVKVSASKELFPLKTDVLVMKNPATAKKTLTETTQTVTTSKTVKKLE